jgi:hypothetical protein
MAQMTGTEIAALARLRAQDPSGIVSDSDVLTYLNDLILWWSEDVEAPRTSTLPASTTGCTIPANQSSVVLTDTSIESILALHPSADSGLTFPLQVPMQRADPEEIWSRYEQRQNTNVRPQISNQWALWGAERDTDNPDAWVIHVWPELGSDYSAVLRCTRRPILTDLSQTPDISYRAGRIIARFLAHDIALQQKQNDEAWLNRILFGVPKNILDNWMGQAKMANATQGYIRDRGQLAT